MQRRRGLECAQLLTARVLTQMLRRSKRLGYCSDDQPAVADLFSTASNRTLIMFCIRTSQATLTFPTNSVLVLIV